MNVLNGLKINWKLLFLIDLYEVGPALCKVYTAIQPTFKANLNILIFNVNQRFVNVNSRECFQFMLYRLIHR